MTVVDTSTDEEVVTIAKVGGFTCTSWWTNVTPGEGDWSWVYMIPNQYAPFYVGRCSNLAPRLRQHYRMHLGDSATATVVACGTEEASARLERALIRMLRPDNNTAMRGKLTYEQTEHFAILDSAWRAGELRICPTCEALVSRVGDQAWFSVAETEPGPYCREHLPPSTFCRRARNWGADDEAGAVRVVLRNLARLR